MPERSPDDVPVPREVSAMQGHAPAPTNVLNVPAQHVPTPGLAFAVMRVPGAPTLPEADPASMNVLLARMATEMFRAPPVVDQPSVTDQHATPGFLSPQGERGQPEAPQSTPTQQSHPLTPTLSPAVVREAIAPASPFHSVPSFDALLINPAPLLSFPLMEKAPAPAPREQHHTPPWQLDTGVPTLEPTRGVFDPHALRREFPILDQKVNGKPLVWLDNAATTQKPQAVIDRLKRFYEHENSNIHRAAHTLAARASDAYEAARESVRRFINAPSVKDIVFVRGATEGINLVAQSWGRRNVNQGDELVITWLEHHANIVPWQQLAAEKGAKLRVAPVDDRGQIILEEYEKLLGPKTRLVSLTQVSNALGTITPLREMITLARRHGAKVLVDGAQAVSHLRVDVQALDCDFFVFSGHKVFAPTGIGAVFGKSDVLEAMPPWQGGGNMIADVTFEKTVYQPAPNKFEAGTGNIADAVGLGAALDWLTRVGLENVSTYEHELLVYATAKLLEVPGLKMYGTAAEKAGVLSFTLEGQKTEEMSALLDKEGIAVRSGHHCAQPILRRLGVEATVRASLAPYNTYEDLDALVAALHRLQAGR